MLRDSPPGYESQTNCQGEVALSLAATTSAPPSFSHVIPDMSNQRRVLSRRLLPVSGSMTSTFISWGLLDWFRVGHAIAFPSGDQTGPGPLGWTRKLSVSALVRFATNRSDVPSAKATVNSGESSTVL